MNVLQETCFEEGQSMKISRVGKLLINMMNGPENLTLRSASMRLKLPFRQAKKIHKLYYTQQRMLYRGQNYQEPTSSDKLVSFAPNDGSPELNGNITIKSESQSDFLKIYDKFKRQIHNQAQGEDSTRIEGSSAFLPVLGLNSDKFHTSHPSNQQSGIRPPPPPLRNQEKQKLLNAKFDSKLTKTDKDGYTEVQIILSTPVPESQEFKPIVQDCFLVKQYILDQKATHLKSPKYLHLALYRLHLYRELKQIRLQLTKLPYEQEWNYHRHSKVKDLLHQEKRLIVTIGKVASGMLNEFVNF